MATLQPPSRRRRTSVKHDAILHELGLEIVSGELPSGTILTLAELEERFSTSRTVVREVVRVLESMGLLVSRRRIGITVQPSSNWSVLEPTVIGWRLQEEASRTSQLVSLHELRRGVEPQAARLAARYASAEQCGRLIDLAQGMRELGRAGGGATEEFLQADIEFHNIVMSCGQNEMFAALGAIIGAVLDGRTRWELQPDYPDTTAMDTHVRLAEAIGSGDEDAAEECAVLLVDIAVNELVEAERELRGPARAWPGAGARAQ